MGKLAHISKRLNHRAIRANVMAEVDGCDRCRAEETDCFVSDILDSIKVPEKYHRHTCKWLYCPRCEAGLYENSWVVRCDAEERPHRRFVARCSIKYDAQLRDFEHHLFRFPSLGMQHQLGKAIWRGISRFPAKTMQQERFVRVRRFDGESGLVKIEQQGMWNPDPMVCHIEGGRYNHEGQSFLYLSSDNETAIVETFVNPDLNKSPTGTCAIQEFEIRNLRRVLDMTRVDHPSLLYSALVYEGTLSQEVTHPWSKPEYLVPRFVADVARAKGFDAMLYRTSKIFYAQGLNLVVFEPKTKNIVKTGALTAWERVLHHEGEELFEVSKYEIVRRIDLIAPDRSCK